MNKPSPPDKEDLEFFKEAMSGVKPTKSVPAKVKSKKNIFEAEKTKSTNLKDDKQQIYLSLFDPTELTIGSEDRLFFSRQDCKISALNNLYVGRSANLIILICIK